MNNCWWYRYHKYLSMTNTEKRIIQYHYWTGINNLKKRDLLFSVTTRTSYWFITGTKYLWDIFPMKYSSQIIKVQYWWVWFVSVTFSISRLWIGLRCGKDNWPARGGRSNFRAINKRGGGIVRPLDTYFTAVRYARSNRFGHCSPGLFDATARDDKAGKLPSPSLPPASPHSADNRNPEGKNYILFKRYISFVQLSALQSEMDCTSRM